MGNADLRSDIRRVDVGGKLLLLQRLNIFNLPSDLPSGLPCFQPPTVPFQERTNLSE